MSSNWSVDVWPGPNRYGDSTRKYFSTEKRMYQWINNEEYFKIFYVYLNGQLVETIDITKLGI